MNIKYKSFITLIVFCLAIPFAKSDDVKTASVQKIDLSFEQAYELMMANNNAIKACLEEIKAKKYEKRAAMGVFSPKIGLNSTYIHFNEDIMVNSPPVSVGAMSIPVPGTLIQNQNVWATSAGAVWNIFTGGKIIAMNSAARAKLEATNEKYRALTNDLTAELVRRYYGLEFAQSVIVVRQQVLNTTKKHLEDAKKLEAEGIIPKSERLHAEVAYRQAERDYNTATRDAEIVEEGLKALIKANNVDLKDIEISPSSLLFVYKKEGRGYIVT